MHREIYFQQNQRDSLISQIYFWNRTLHFSDRFSVHDGQKTCPKHVDFYSKNKFQKLVQLVGFVITIYISYFDYVPSLKKAFIAETCCRLLVMDEAVFRLHLHFFYLLVYLNSAEMTCLKIVSFKLSFEDKQATSVSKQKVLRTDS